MNKVFLILLCALAMQGHADLCDTMKVSCNAGGNNFAGYCQLIQIVNGYLIFQYSGEFGGPDGIFYKPIAFEIKNPETQKTKEYLSQLHIGIQLWRMMDSGTVIYKKRVVQMETTRGFTEEIGVYGILKQ